MSKLILFTTSFPYLPGETFLEEELPFLASKFSSIIIYPLFKSGKECIKREVSDNVIVKETLIRFSHKDRLKLIINGLFSRDIIPQIKEFLCKKVFLKGKKTWIFFNYTLLYNSIRNNKRVIKDVISELRGANVAYFYWGDKSALLTPFLKKSVPEVKYVVRFHGSDLYLYAKGFLPYRERLFKTIDYAIPISKHGAHYISANYSNLIEQSRIKCFRLGSFNNYIGKAKERVEDNVFRIISCSNVIELKQVELIAKALLNIAKDYSFCKKMESNGYNNIEWSHIGDGPLLPEIKELCSREILESKNKSYLTTNFTGSLSHSRVLELYSEKNYNLFVMASRSEGIPVSIMEAFSFGVPAIATNVGGVSELFSNGTLLPATLNVEELTESLTNAIKKAILLPINEQKRVRELAKTEWKTNWDGTKNYKEFTEFLINL